MKLEIKHLAPYLPYGLKYMDWDYEQFSLDGLDVNGDAFCADSGEVSFELIKPILRPLSDLTKEINLHDDFFAIPIENMTGYKLEGYPNDAPTTVQHLYGCSKGEIDAKFLDYWVITKLLEWHFDVFGLREKDLCVYYDELNI